MSLWQMEETRQLLDKLEADGLELVTNIKAAGDSKDNQRRMFEEDGRRLRYCRVLSF